MTNLEMLCWGIQHISDNHGFDCDTDYGCGTICVFGCNVPTLCDVQMLCEDLNVPREDVFSTDSLIEVTLDEEWVEIFGSAEYIPGMEFWRRKQC